MLGISNKKILVLTTSLLVPLLTQAGGLDGIYFEKTRVIVGDGNNQGTITVKNTSSRNVLIYSKIENENREDTTKAQSLPRLFQVKAGKTGVLRITINPQTLPKDRETQLWLYTKMFPEAKVSNKDELRFNFVNRFKVFYRPQGIDTDMYGAISNVDWKVENGKLVGANNSPLTISLNSVDIDHVKHNVGRMIKPYSVWKSDIPVNCTKCSFKWSAVNDYGASIEFEKIYR